MSQSQIAHTSLPETPSKLEPNVNIGEPIITVPNVPNAEPSIPPQYWGTGTGIILEIAILVRSLALLIQVLSPLILQHKSGSSKQ